MNVDNVRSQMRKGMLEYCIFIVVAQKSRHMLRISFKN